VEDDLEEMKTLRDAKPAKPGGFGSFGSFGPSAKKPMPKESAASSTSSAAPATTTGTKKARTFDLEAMLRQARIHAAENSYEAGVIEEEIGLPDPEEGKDNVSQLMGFSSFGDPKKAAKAKTFNVNAIFEEAKKTARQSTSSSQDSPAEMKGPSPQKKADSDDDDDLIGPPLPPSAQKSSDDDMGPPLPSGFIKPRAKRHSDDSDSDDDSDDDDNPISKIPCTHEVALTHGTKTVSALGMDPAGARLASGGYDYDVSFWDFAGMDATMKSFRTLRPCECHMIRSLEYSMTGDVILVVAGNSQAKVIDRDGFVAFECIKGDQYLMDMAKTKGHTAMLNSGCWNPKVKQEFMTCSNDGTVRLWDINDEGKKHQSIIRFKNRQGRKTTPTTCCYSRDGTYVAAGLQDGAIQLWDRRKMFVNPAMTNRDCHQNGTDTSSLCFSYDNRVLASRGGDDTVKTWDIRKFKQPLAEAKGLYNQFSMTDVVFSPDDKLVVTGISLNKDETDGKLVFLDRETLNRAKEIVVSNSSVVRTVWHPRLNQIVVGCGNGEVKVFYDNKKSQR
jgi:WD40 repeat protein